MGLSVANARVEEIKRAVVHTVEGHKAIERAEEASHNYAQGANHS